MDGNDETDEILAGDISHFFTAKGTDFLSVEDLYPWPFPTEGDIRLSVLYHVNKHRFVRSVTCSQEIVSEKYLEGFSKLVNSIAPGLEIESAIGEKNFIAGCSDCSKDKSWNIYGYIDYKIFFSNYKGYQKAITELIWQKDIDLNSVLTKMHVCDRGMWLSQNLLKDEKGIVTTMHGTEHPDHWKNVAARFHLLNMEHTDKTISCSNSSLAYKPSSLQQ